MNPISQLMRQHYAAKFDAHGPTSEGVDWGPDRSRMLLRFDKMLAVAGDRREKASWLDVGCGYGGLLQYAQQKQYGMDYHGIDVAENMIRWAAANFEGGTFICADVLDDSRERVYDYVVCSGILTQKLSASLADMDVFAGRLIRRMFALCRHGIAFNVMTTKVNYFADNLYYRNPAEMLAWCMTEISRNVRLDHAYPLYEYTVYLYRDGQ